jgi:hypothetical protein
MSLYHAGRRDVLGICAPALSPFGFLHEDVGVNTTALDPAIRQPTACTR